MKFTVEYLFNLRDRFSSKAGAMARASAKARSSIHATGSAFNKMEGDANRAGVAVNKLATRMRSLNTVTRNIRSGGLAGVMTGVGGGMGAYGASRAIKRFADYETALVNIRKVWTGSDKEYDEMVKRLKTLNSRMPLSRAKIAGTLEQALRAGVAEDARGLVEATEQFARMGVAFNIPAEEAAVLLSKLRSALEMTAEQFERFGDTANTVANKFPMSEMELFEVLRRQAALGKSIAGMQGAYDVLTIGAAQLAVGTPKEVAATGLRTLLTRLNTQPKDTQIALKALGLGSKAVKKMLTKDLFGTVRMILGKIATLPASEKAGILARIAGFKAFDAFSRVIASITKLDDVRGVVDDTFRLTAMSEYQRKLKTLNAALQISQNTFEDFSDSLVKYWDPTIRKALRSLQDMAKSMEGNPWLAWSAGIYVAASALALLLFPLGMLAWSLAAIGPAVAMAALGLNRIARIAALPFFATIGAAAGYMARLLAALVGFGPKATNVISKLVRGFAGFTAIGLAIQGVVEYFSEIKSFFSGFFSGIAENWEGSELQRALSWLSGILESTVKYLADLTGFEFKSDGLKAFFEAGAAAAKILLNPLESIRAAFEYLLGLLGRSFRLTGQAQATASTAGAKLGSTAALKNATSVQKRQAAMNAMLMRHEKAKPLSFEGVQKYRVQSTVDVNFTNPTVNVKVDASGVANRVVPLPASVQPRGTSTALPGVESGL